MEQYSLATHTVTITLDNSKRSIILGNGSALDTIDVARSNDNVSHTASADGTYAVNVNFIKLGTVSLAIRQTVSFNKNLQWLFAKQIRQDYGLVVTEAATITIRDGFGNIAATGKSAFLTRPADYSASDEAQPRTWNFTCGEVDFGSGEAPKTNV